MTLLELAPKLIMIMSFYISLLSVFAGMNITTLILTGHKRGIWWWVMDAVNLGVAFFGVYALTHVMLSLCGGK